MITRLLPSPPSYDATPEQVQAYFAQLAREDAEEWNWFCFLVAASFIVLSVIGYVLVNAAIT